MRKIKVLHLITNLPPGGAQDNTIFTVNLHDKERYEVWLAAMPVGRFAELAPDVRLEVIPSLRWEINPGKDLRALREIYRLVRRERFDIVHTHISKAGILGRLAARLAGVPIVVHTIHTFAFHDFQLRWKNALYIGLERMAAPLTSKFITVSRLNIGKSLRAGIGRPDQFQTIYSAIDLQQCSTPSAPREAIRRQLGLDPKRPLVGVIGRLTFQKNPVCFVEAVALIATRYPHSQFVMVGDGELRPEVEARIAALGLADRILLLGHRNDTPDMFHMLDIFVHTSRYEGMGRVFAEAMAMRLPIIATDVDGVSEAVDGRERGLLVPPDDPAALADAMCVLLDDPERGRRMGETGHRWVMQHFDVGAMVRSIEDLYEHLLAARGLPARPPAPAKPDESRGQAERLPGLGSVSR